MAKTTIFTDIGTLGLGIPDRRALVIQPGGLGDTLLTIPLARFLRRQPQVVGVDVMGHDHYARFLPGRTVYEQFLSLDNLPLHRLFVPHGEFDLPDGDPLIGIFSRYDLIVTFLADDQGYFQANLIFTTNINHPTEVHSLVFCPPLEYPGHVAGYVLEQMAGQLEAPMEAGEAFWAAPLLQPKPTDRQRGTAILVQHGLDSGRPTVVIHPGSGGVGKCWPKANFFELARFLTQKDLQVALVLGPAELERWTPGDLAVIPPGVAVIKELETIDLVGVLAVTGAFVGNDSGPTHLAGAMDLPTVAIFGPTSPTHWRPLGGRTVVLADQSGPGCWPTVDEVLVKILSLSR